MRRVELGQLDERRPRLGKPPRMDRGLRGGKALFHAPLARALLETRPALHGHERAIVFVAGRWRPGMAECWHRAAQCKMRSGTLLLPLLDFGPGIPQRDRAIENESLRSGIRIDAEVPQPFELNA